ncbi:MAG: hypothetical protein QXQ53_01230 [Candidatus Methanosuratincola sp.]
MPEQILSRTAEGKKLFDFTVRNQRLFRNTAELFKRRVDKILDHYGIHDEQSVNQMLTLIEFPYYNKRLPTYEELSAFPRNVVAAARDHLKYITDPIWRIAKRYDPEIGYVPGYFTHFPVRNRLDVLRREIVSLERDINQIRQSGDPSATNVLSSLEAALHHLRSSLAKAEAIDAALATRRAKTLETTLTLQRYGILPRGGYYGPLDEARIANSMWGYSTNYRDVMHDYIDGAFRKIFLDKYSPVANAIARTIQNPAYRQYAYDYITAQRGALGAKTRLFLNEALRQIFPGGDEEATGRLLSRAVDFTTRFQYLSKIGLSWLRFPLVNITQPLLTTYPIVGERNFILGFFDLFSPKIWRLAAKVGVTFEPTVRRAVTEFLGRGKWTQVERYLALPAELSERANRVWSFAAGLRYARELGLKGTDALRHAIDVVNRTQFLYHTEALPLWTRNPIGRLVLQFRTFTANYVNYLIQLFNTGTPAQKIRALTTLGVLSSSSAFPLWESVRELLLRKAGIDIGEYNLLEYTTERLGLQPGINIGTSLEPWNFPYSLYNLLGPSIGPLTELMFSIRRQPERAGEFLRRFAEQISPPVFVVGRGLLGREVRGEPTKTQPMGRYVGRRPTIELLYLRPFLESQRRHYLHLIANAMVGGRPDLVAKYVERMRQIGINVTSHDLAIARRMATELAK